VNDGSSGFTLPAHTSARYVSATPPQRTGLSRMEDWIWIAMIVVVVAFFAWQTTEA
jgi:hypothetical protein